MLSDAIQIGEGYGSKVYATSDGKIVRVAKNLITQQRHQRERIVLGVLKKYIRSVAIPEPTVFIEPSKECPYGALGYDRIAGKPLRPEDIPLDHQTLLAQQVAQFIAELHHVPLEEVKKVVSLPVYLPSPNALEKLWTRVGVYISEHAPELLPSIKTAFAASSKAASRMQETSTLVHGDLWYENMIFDGNKNIGIIDFEAVSSGPPIVDFMTQGYVGNSFRQDVVRAFQKYGSFAYDEALGRSLMYLREMSGLDYGIMTNDVDADSLAKIADAAALM